MYVLIDRTAKQKWSSLSASPSSHNKQSLRSSGVALNLLLSTVNGNAPERNAHTGLSVFDLNYTLHMALHCSYSLWDSTIVIVYQQTIFSVFLASLQSIVMGYVFYFYISFYRCLSFRGTHETRWKRSLCASLIICFKNKYDVRTTLKKLGRTVSSYRKGLCTVLCKEQNTWYKQQKNMFVLGTMEELNGQTNVFWL